MTRRLYYTDARRTEFTATVVGRADDGRRIYLDETAFYPTSGGQPFDTGTLDGARVVDVVDEEDRIAHVLDRPLPADTHQVRGTVDWARRWDHMQQHTGQHLLSAVFEDLLGHRTVSVHFGAESSTLDLDAAGVSAQALARVEARANELVSQAIPVTVTFEDAATAAGLRKATGRTGEIRIVTIAGVDRSACGGTHVATTAEIGAVLLRRTEKVKQGTRVEFVCGGRAIERARADLSALSRVAQALSSSLDEAPASLEARLAHAQQVEGAARKLERELDAYRARERYDAAAPDTRGVRRVIERRPAGTLDDLRGLAHAVCALPGAAFIGVIEESGAIIVGTSEDSALEAGPVLKRALALVQGKGGGSPRMAQGSAPAAEVDHVIAAVLQEWDAPRSA